MSKEEEIKDHKKPRCTLISVLVIVLLILLGYFVMKDTKKTMIGGEWTATGGCACLPPK